MAAKKKPSRVKTVRFEDYTPLEIRAIQIREWYIALRKAGFPVDIAITLCVDPSGQPEWFDLPKKESEDIGRAPYYDDEEDD